MQFKLDENLGSRLVPVFEEHGHTVDTVMDEGLCGARDTLIYKACLQESRTLVTLDLDFSDPNRFPPGPTNGIVILRPKRPLMSLIQGLLKEALRALATEEITGSIWIVEPGRIRVHDPN